MVSVSVLFCLAVVACVAADTVDDIPIDNAQMSAQNNQLTVKLPAKPEISLVIFHLSFNSALQVPNGGDFDSPILKESKDGFFQWTGTVPNVTSLSGKSIYYWIRVEITKDGKTSGHNSGVRNFRIP